MGGSGPGRTRTGFGRTGRTCRILSSRAGGTRCSRFNRSTFGRKNNTNTNNFRNNFNNFNNRTKNFNSVFNSVFNNVFNNKHRRRNPRGNGSLHRSVSVSFRSTTFNGSVRVRIRHRRRYSRYRNANNRPNSHISAYPGYRNSNRRTIVRGAPFKHVRSIHAYSHYRNANGDVRGPYSGYHNANRVLTGQGVSVGVPTNMSDKSHLHMTGRKRPNVLNNPGKSLCMCVFIHPRGRFRQGNGSIVDHMGVDFTRTTLNTAVRIGALSNGMRLGVPRNARAKATFHMGNGNVPCLHGPGRENSRRVIMAIRAPGGLASARHRLLLHFTGRDGRSMGGLRIDGDLFRGVGSYLAG